MSRLDPAKLARLGALALAGGAVLAAALVVGGKAPPAGVRAKAPATSLSAELDRCRTLGAAAQDDRLCRLAWRTSREQFLGAPGARP